MGGDSSLSKLSFRRSAHLFFINIDNRLRAAAVRLRRFLGMYAVPRGFIRGRCSSGWVTIPHDFVCIQVLSFCARVDFKVLNATPSEHGFEVGIYCTYVSRNSVVPLGAPLLFGILQEQFVWHTIQFDDRIAGLEYVP